MILAETVVIAIGLQGNLRKMGVPGEDNGLTHYQLDDPKDYWDKDIVVDRRRRCGHRERRGAGRTTRTG